LIYCIHTAVKQQYSILTHTHSHNIDARFRQDHNMKFIFLHVSFHFSLSSSYSILISNSMLFNTFLLFLCVYIYTNIIIYYAYFISNVGCMLFTLCMIITQHNKLDKVKGRKSLSYFPSIRYTFYILSYAFTHTHTSMYIHEP
jgi:hypothetical protein